MPNFVYKTNSSNQTKKLSNLLASCTKSQRRSNLKSALIFALTGELGSGKTTFVQGFLRGLGVRKKITSPTFVITKSYKLKAKSYQTVYHIDCYRIKRPSELLKLGIKEILNDSRNIVLIEWAEKIKRILPKNIIWIKFQHGEKINNQRIIEFYKKVEPRQIK